MRKTINRYWMINLLTGVILYISYRVVIMQTESTGDGLSATVLNILDIALNLGFSLMYLVAILIFSAAVLLNRIQKVRDSYLLSWLTFAGAALILVLFAGINVLNSYNAKDNVMTRLLIVSLIYLLLTTLLFIQFRKSLFKK